MKTYAILEVINGNFFVRAEGISNLDNAKKQFHGRCEALWNAADVNNAYVMIADDTLSVVDGYKEFIHHEPA